MIAVIVFIMFEVNWKGSRFNPKSSTYSLVWVTSSQSFNSPGPLLPGFIVLMKRLVEKMYVKCFEECRHILRAQ